MPSAANSSDPAEAGASPPRPSRAPLYWILGGLVAFVALSLAVAIYTDDLPPDVSDLAFTPIEVADDENLYLLLIKRGEALKTSPIIREDEPDDPPPPVPEGGAAPAEESGLFGSSAPGSKSLRDKLLVGQSWTPERLARWCPALDQLVAECRELAKYEKMQGATLRKFDDTTKFREIRGVFIQLTLAAWAQFRSGRQAEAVDTALLGLDLGRRLADDRGCMQDYFCGLAVKGFFQCALHDMAACDEISSAALGAIFDGVIKTPNGSDYFAHSLRKEFQCVSDILRAHSAAEVSSYGFNPRFVTEIARTRVLFPLIYKPNQTVALYADHIRESLSHYDEPLASRKAKWGAMAVTWLEPSDLLRPHNIYGRMLGDTLGEGLDHLPTTRHQSFSRHSALVAYVALRIYHREHGNLPATLDELVPAYFPSVPLDYIDRAPIRYSRDFRAVWSVGTDALRILSADQEVKEREVFHRLDFAAPPTLPAAPMEASAAPAAAPAP